MNDVLNWLGNTRYLPWTLMIVFISFIAWNLWTLKEKPADFFSNQQHYTHKSSSTGQPSNMKKTLEYPLFGIYLPEGAGEIKASSLDIKVVGIMLASGSTNSHVLLELANNEQKVYQVGDELPGGAQIKKITSDGVLIWYNGRLERMELSLDELEFNAREAPLKQESL